MTRRDSADEGILVRIGQTVMLHTGGDREEARNRFVDLWEEVGERGDPYHRCILAHYLADTEADPVDELDWDLRALTAADTLLRQETATAPGEPAGDLERGDGLPADADDLPVDAGAATGDPQEAAGHRADAGEPARRRVSAVRALYPELYLNLACDLWKLGRPEAARRELDRARSALGVLPDDAYLRGTRAAIERLAARLADRPGPALPPAEGGR